MTSSRTASSVRWGRGASGSPLDQAVNRSSTSAIRSSTSHLHASVVRDILYDGRRNGQADPVDRRRDRGHTRSVLTGLVAENRGGRGMTAAEPTTARATTYSEHVSELVVAGREPVADGVVSLVLEHPDGEELPAWTPGAHVDLVLAPDLTRQYSLCGSPADSTRWRVGVLFDEGGRGGSRHVHEQLEVGSRLPVRGPRNHFPLVASERYLFIAGGIDITPLMPMVAEAEQAGADWTLFYGGRRRGSMAFVDELAAYGDRVVLRPEDEYGLLDLATILAPQPGTAVYSCRPETPLQAAARHCAPWPPGSLHVERFAA